MALPAAALLLLLLVLPLVLLPRPLEAAGECAGICLGYQEFPPYIFKGADNAPRGIVKDLWALWSEKSGIPLRFLEVAPEERQKSLDSGLIQGMALDDGFLSSSRRIPLPLDPVPVFAYLAKGSRPEKSRVSGLTGKKMAICAGSRLSPKEEKALAGITLRRLGDRKRLVPDALAENCRGFIMAQASAAIFLARENKDGSFLRLAPPLFYRQLAAGIVGHDQDLHQAVTEGFSRISDREIRDLVQTWTGRAKQMVWRPHTRPLRIAASIDNMPFHFADEKGRAVGMFVDLWRLWSEKTGLPVEFIPVPWAKSLEMVKNGEADIHAGCFFSPQRDGYLDYGSKLRDCETHFFFHDSVYGLKELADLKGFQIGVLDQDYAVEFMHREMPGAALKLYPSHQALFKGVAAGDIKVFICDTPTALFFLTREKLADRFRYHPDRPLYRKPFFAAVREGNTHLLERVNQGLAAISQEERARIERQWMGKDAAGQGHSRIIIGADQSFPPFSMRSAGGEPSGLMVDFWKAWAEKTGRKITIRLMERQAAVHALKDGRIDILTGVPPQKTTHGWAGFALPHYRVDWYLYRYAGQGPGQVDLPMSFEQMSGTLGVLADSRISEWVLDREPPPKVQTYASTEQMILAAVRGKIDAFLATPQEMAVLPGRLGLAGGFLRGKTPVLQEKLRAGIRNYTPELMALINAGFAGLSQGEKARIESAWIPEPGLRIFSPEAAGFDLTGLTDEESRWLNRHRISGRPVRVGIRMDREPFEFKGDDGRPAGMAADVLRLLAKRTGLNIEIVGEMAGRAAGGAMDMVTAYRAQSGRDPQRRLSRPYLEFPWVIITRTRAPVITGLADMQGKHVAVVRGYRYALEDWPGLTPLVVADSARGLDALVRGRADAFVDNLAAAGYGIQAKATTRLKVAGAAALEKEGLCFAVDKGQPELLSIVNKGIGSMSKAQLDHIRQRYFAVPFEQGPDMAAIRALAVKIALGVVLVFVLILGWNWMIRQREERFRCLIEQGSDLIFALGPQGRIRYASPSHKTVLGLNPKTVRKGTVSDLVVPEDLKGFQQMLVKLNHPGSRASRTIRMADAEGRILWFEAHCMNLLQNRAIKAYVVNARDITQTLEDRHLLEQAKEAAEAANRSKTDFLAGLSHEVRTPLNAILGMTENALSTVTTPDQADPLKTVFSAARHLKAVIGDIMDYATLEAGKVSLRDEVFSLEEMVADLVRIWRPMAKQKGLAFEASFASELPDLVVSDPLRIRQILTNLLSNALKFTSGGRILFQGVSGQVVSVSKAHPKGRHKEEGMPEDSENEPPNPKIVVSFSVEDSGIGIEPDQIHLIFRRFARAGGEKTGREFGGTGLGLNISKDLALLLGGDLTVRSQPGRGSCFTLTVPLKRASVSQRVETREPQSCPDLQGRTLVLAEDDAVNRAVFKGMVAETGCNVVCANNGIEVLDILRSEAADLVFMDLEMPDMDGLSACIAIRGGEAGKAAETVPVVAMTAHVLDDFRQKARQVGMNGFLAKPVEKKELFSVLDEMLTVETPPVDMEKALAALGGDRQLTNRVNAIFVSQTPGLLNSLRQALAEGDAAAIALAAHTLKGAGKRVFAHGAADAAAGLERLAREMETGQDPAADLMKRMGPARDETFRAFEKVIDYLA